MTKNIKKAKEVSELFASELTGKICLQKFQILGPERKPWARKALSWWRWIRLGNIWTNCAYRSPCVLVEWAHESWGSQLTSLWWHSQWSQNHRASEVGRELWRSFGPSLKGCDNPGEIPEHCPASAGIFLYGSDQLRCFSKISAFSLFSLKCIFSSVFFHWLRIFTPWRTQCVFVRA